MSGHDADEDLKNKDEVRATLFVQWSDDDKLQKKRSTLQKVLQTLVSKSKFNGDCDVLNVSEDGRAEIKIKPAAAVIELQQMSGQPLRAKDGKTVTIMSISLKPPEPERRTADSTLEKIPSSPVSEPQNVDRQLGGQRSDITSFAYDIPMLHYWYVNQAYKREIERIEKESGGKVMAEMKLTFKPHQKDGNPNFAFSEFTNLVQKCSAESRGFTFPLRKVNPEGLKNTMEIIQRPENKLWIALSSEDMTVCGPRESQDAIRKSLNAEDKTLIITHTPAGRFIQTSQKTTLKTAFSSEQPSTSHDECAETDQTEQPRNATEDSTNPNTSAGEMTQVQASYVSQSDIRMDVQLYGQQGPYQYPMGNSSNPAQNNFTNPHPSPGQFPQPFQYPPVNMPIQGQHPHAMRGPHNPAQNNCTNLHPSAGQVPQKTSVNTEVQGQHQCTTGNPSNPVQYIYTNPHPSDGQFPHMYQNPSVNTPTQGQHPNATGEMPQNNYPSAGQFPQDTTMNTENKDEVRAIFFVQWSDGDKPQKKKSTLQKDLQTLANKGNFKGDCTVLNVSEDGRAEIKIKPAAAMSNFKELLRKPIKTKDGKTVTITDVSMALPQLDIQTPDQTPINHPPSSVSEPQHVRGQFGKQSDTAPFSHNVPVHTDNASMTRPPSSVSEQQHVKGKHREQSDITTSTNVLKPTDNDCSQQEVNLTSLSVSEKENDQEPPVEQSGSSSSVAVSTREEKACCVLPVVHFWYVNHIFKEDIKRIERRHGVKMNAEVTVTFVADQKDEGLTKAQSEFTDLVQKGLPEFDGSVTPLKSVDIEEFKDALKMIQRPENKLLVSLSSDEMTIYGPKPIPTAITKSLNAAQTSSANAYDSAAESQVRSLNIGMSINDCLVNNGLNMQESHWKLMTASYCDDVDKIKKKFSVDFKDSGVHHGKINVKAHYKRSGGNASMESHAVRALLHLCQKIATSPKNITQHRGATGFSGSTKNSSSLLEGPSSGPVVNSQSGYSTRKTEESAGKGATAGDNADEECPICKDTFKNKKQLKCKHEFCEECLEESKKHMGPVCPVCKDVFGVIEGTQPDGKMSSYKSTLSLPGFENCGSIVINYYFPSGKQTKMHPNPGQSYDGTSRTAYLPDNKEGKEVLSLLKKAFDQKLIFTVGTSTTTGIENQVTWNDIHHKTSMTGGPQRFGYPDPDYLRRVRDELKAKGIE